MRGPLFLPTLVALVVAISAVPAVDVVPDVYGLQLVLPMMVIPVALNPVMLRSAGLQLRVLMPAPATTPAMLMRELLRLPVMEFYRPTSVMILTALSLFLFLVAPPLPSALYVVMVISTEVVVIFVMVCSTTDETRTRHLAFSWTTMGPSLPPWPIAHMPPRPTTTTATKRVRCVVDYVLMDDLILHRLVTLYRLVLRVLLIIMVFCSVMVWTTLWYVYLLLVLIRCDR